MKILHIVAGDPSSGAAICICAYWLHQGLLVNGVDSRVLVSAKDTLGNSFLIGNRTVVVATGSGQ
jgi:hypothetical protein